MRQSSRISMWTPLQRGDVIILVGRAMSRMTHDLVISGNVYAY